MTLFTDGETLDATELVGVQLCVSTPFVIAGGPPFPARECHGYVCDAGRQQYPACQLLSPPPSSAPSPLGRPCAPLPLPAWSPCVLPHAGLTGARAAAEARSQSGRDAHCPGGGHQQWAPGGACALRWLPRAAQASLASRTMAVLWLPARWLSAEDDSLEKGAPASITPPAPCMSPASWSLHGSWRDVPRGCARYPARLPPLRPSPCSCLFFNTGRVQSSLLPEKMGLPADLRGDIVCETKGNVQAIVRGMGG